MLTIAAVVVVSLAWIRRRPASGPALALAFCSLHVWAYFALVAAVQAGLNRYSAAYEPVLIPIFTLAIAVVIGLSRHSLEARRVARSVPVGAASEHVGSRAD